jgi:dihydrolipoamide dehydrogenase
VSDDNFDVAIIGGGSAGYACALRAAQLGKNVLLVEHDQLGGTCTTVAFRPRRSCTPRRSPTRSAKPTSSV